MQTTIGDLVTELYDAFEERSHDPELAAIATAATVNDLLCEVAHRGRSARDRAPDESIYLYETRIGA